MLKDGLTILLDSQWGSTGKGKVSGYLGRFAPHLSCASFGPNAGHTFVDDEGESTVFKFLPTSVLVAGCPALIMPDSVIDVDAFMEEVKKIKSPVYVHPRVAILTKEDALVEQKTMRHLASTMQGTGSAISRKILRSKGIKLAKDVLPSDMVRDTSEMVRSCLNSGGKVLMEMSQGFDLSINHGYSYPYLTSRDITVGAALNSLGVSHKADIQVIGSMRTFPIRVGNIKDGSSGPHHPDQMELTWKDIAQQSGATKDLTETTTVTKRTRRVFTFSMMQLKHFIAVNSPDWMFLNFIQYLDWSMFGAKRADRLTENASQFISNFYEETGVEIKLVGTGSRDSEIIELGVPSDNKLGKI